MLSRTVPTPCECEPQSLHGPGYTPLAGISEYVLSGQGVVVAEPSQVFPGGQLAHVSVSGAVVSSLFSPTIQLQSKISKLPNNKCPDLAGQDVHGCAFGLVRLMSKNSLFPHAVHDVLPAFTALCPFAHGLHVLSEVALVAVENLPAAQSVHAAWSGSGL